MVLEFSSVSMLVGLLFNAIALLIYCKVRNLHGKSIEGGPRAHLMRPPCLCTGSVVKGRLPQLGEKVLVKAAYNPGQAVPWNAVKVQTLSNQVFISP